MKVLFVCTGNTCRSPMAKMILKQKLKKAGVTFIKVFSAGLAINEKGLTAESAIALKKLGFVKEKHIATDVRTLNLNEYRIFTLTDAHKQALGAYCQSACDIIGHDIIDPWMMPQKVYDECAGQIEKFCDAIISQIVTVEVKKQ